MLSPASTPREYFEQPPEVRREACYQVYQHVSRRDYDTFNRSSARVAQLSQQAGEHRPPALHALARPSQDLVDLRYGGCMFSCGCKGFGVNHAPPQALWHRRRRLP